MNSGMKGREEDSLTSECEINEDINKENVRHISKDMTKGKKVDGNENRTKNKNRCINETKDENTIPKIKSNTERQTIMRMYTTENIKEQQFESTINQQFEAMKKADTM